jgi:polysaccharide deacetylase family sporulation protein PdaB
MRKVNVFLLGAALACLPFALGAQGEKSNHISPPPLNFDTAMESRLYETLTKGINTHVIWAGNPHYKNIALTFDDGPNPKTTPRVLNILEEQKVRATFFLIGQQAQRHPEVVKLIRQAGHQLGNHTYSHIKLNGVPSETIKQELEKTREILREITGETPVLFRPPWGFFDPRSLAQIAQCKFNVVLWSVDSRDWSRAGAGAIKGNIFAKVQNGSIILCHDDHDQLVEALPDIIKGLKEEGYQFITVSEMMALSM